MSKTPFPRHQHHIVIDRVAFDQVDAPDLAFFEELDEQTTWDSLPPDRRGGDRQEFRRRLLAVHEALLARPGHILLFAREAQDGERLGVLWLGPRLNPVSGEEEAWIFSITIAPQHRGCGVASVLMREAESLARSLGHHAIGLSVASHNERARAVYEKLGFGVSNLLMRKPL